MLLTLECPFLVNDLKFKVQAFYLSPAPSLHKAKGNRHVWLFCDIRVMGPECLFSIGRDRIYIIGPTLVS